MKRFFVLIGIIVAIASTTTADNFLNNPEGVVYDSLHQRYLVANAEDGYIVQIDKYRQQSIFTGGFNIPLGLKIVDSILYVTTNDPPVLYGVHLETSEILVNLPIPTAFSLAGLDTDTSGYLYMIDQTGNIFRVDLSNHNYNLFVGSGLPNGLQGLVFDDRYNRFILCSYPSGSALLGLNLNPLTLNTLEYTAGGVIPITRDNFYNFYYGSWNTDVIYIIDSLFDGPASIFSSGHNNPGGLFYNNFLEEIAITSNASNKIDFKHLYVEFEADTCFGWAPFEVSFTPTTERVIETWLWDFGDGDSATTETISHTYTQSGFYDVSLTVTCSDVNDQDDHTHIKFGYICILGDTLSGDHIEGETDTTLEITVSAVNNMPLEEITLPVQYDGPIDLTFAGYATEGCRYEDADYEDITYVNYDAGNKRFTLNMVVGENTLPTGTGPLIKLLFNITSGNDNDSTLVRFDNYNTYEATFSGLQGVYHPEVSPGSIKYIYTGCCIGTTGNVNCSVEEEPDITDITSLIDFLYILHTPLCCLEEADVNISGGEPDISDITALINHLYIDHDPLPDCP